MEQVKWFERKFNFTITENILPSVVERLRGTPARLDEKMTLIPAGLLAHKISGTWSIKENLGHLSDLEPLWQGRVEDIKNGLTELRPTDLQNSKTDLANHNDTSLEELLRTFRQLREKTVSILEGINEETIFKSALHPRLKTPMRVLDIAIFTADHDDHHLARMTEIARILK